MLKLLAFPPCHSSFCDKVDKDFKGKTSKLCCTVLIDEIKHIPDFDDDDDDDDDNDDDDDDDALFLWYG